MKLGIVVPGGVARCPEDGRIPCLLWLIEGLARRHEVHVFSLRGGPRPECYRLVGATVHHAGRRPTAVRALAAIAREHRRAPFHLLHAFWVTPPGVVTACARRLLRCPAVVHVSGGEIVALPDIRYGNLCTRRGRLWVGIGLAGASRITAATGPGIATLRTLGFTAERIPLGVDLAHWPAVAPRPRRSGTALRLVHVADLNPVKDQPTLLEAARLLAARGVEFHLDIAGRDTLDGAIQRHADRLGVADRVRFHGRLPHERLHPLVAAADLLWHSSRHEAGPVVVLEAAVAGVPTVGTAVGHIAEWAPDAAVAVPVGDAAALARETLGLLRDDGRRLALAHEAQRRAIARDAEWTAARFEALYEELVTGATRRGPGR